jgi:hypothetical protein
MKRGWILLVVAIWCVLACALFAQRPFREYPGWEYSVAEGNGIPLPKDYNVPGEWTFARLMYPSSPLVIDWQSTHKRGYDWREGNTNWTIDYPRSDRHLSEAIRRLTRVQTRSAEQPVNLDDETEDVFNYPWLYAVEVGHWELTDPQIAKFREFLLRGGFFMCDDFHGMDEWNTFIHTMHKVFPNRTIVDLPNSDAIFHTVFDLDDRYQVPGAQYIQTHSICEKCPTFSVIGRDDHGLGAEWRGIYDDTGRLMVAICHNMDLGDSWEHADNPEYPQKFSALGIRIGVNYITYAMTH